MRRARSDEIMPRVTQLDGSATNEPILGPIGGPQFWYLQYILSCRQKGGPRNCPPKSFLRAVTILAVFGYPKLGTTENSLDQTSVEIHEFRSLTDNGPEQSESSQTKTR